MVENRALEQWNRLGQWVRKTQDWVRFKVRPGLRSLAGLGLISGGIVGFLPIVGFWMIPLGIMFIWIDISSLIGGAGKNAGRGGSGTISNPKDK